MVPVLKQIPLHKTRRRPSNRTYRVKSSYTGSWVTLFTFECPDVGWVGLGDRVRPMFRVTRTPFRRLMYLLRAYEANIA